MKLTDAKKLSLLMEELKNLEEFLENLKQLKMTNEWYGAFHSSSSNVTPAFSTRSSQTGGPWLARKIMVMTLEAVDDRIMQIECKIGGM